MFTATWLPMLYRTGILTGDDKNALKFFDIYRRAIDYRADRAYQNALMEMQTRYETERTELKLTSLEKQKKLGITITASGFSYFNSDYCYLVFPAPQSQK